MKTIDFITPPPSNKLSIFTKQRNKTTLGGVIFIIEIVAIILITFIYLFDHFNNLPYTIETNTIFESGIAVHEFNGDVFDQKTNFSFNIYTDYTKSKEVSDKFEIVDYSSQEYSYNIRKTGITKKPSMLKLAVYYKCHNETVCKYFEDGRTDIDYTRENYIFQINYPGFIISHQLPEPIRDLDEVISMECPFLFDIITKSKFHWKNIKYEEDNGMWSRLFNNYILRKDPTSYYKGFIESTSTYPVEIEEFWAYTPSNTHKLLAIIEIENNPYNYTYYRRIPNSVFTTIANIAALISTVNFLLASFLYFYSRNYDNYTIIRYITSPKKNLIKNDLTQNSNQNLEINELNELDGKNEETNAPLINNENEMLNNEIGEDIVNQVNENNNTFSFIQFFMNNLYFSCCKKTKVQEIIKLSNEIVEKYLSVENLMYNQIIMENLLKDYKWNDPNLNNIKKNELIIKFNNLN